jgi:flagellin
MTSQIRGMTQATRNANDGVRWPKRPRVHCRARATSCNVSANWPYNRRTRRTRRATARRCKPRSQLNSELNRIATTTSFNGQAAGRYHGHGQLPGRRRCQPADFRQRRKLTNTYGNNRIENDAVAAATTTTVAQQSNHDQRQARLGHLYYGHRDAVGPPVLADTAKSIAAASIKNLGHRRDGDSQNGSQPGTGRRSVLVPDVSDNDGTRTCHVSFDVGGSAARQPTSRPASRHQCANGKTGVTTSTIRKLAVSS